MSQPTGNLRTGSKPGEQTGRFSRNASRSTLPLLGTSVGRSRRISPAESDLKASVVAEPGAGKQQNRMGGRSPMKLLQQESAVFGFRFRYPKKQQLASFCLRTLSRRIGK